MSSSDRKNLSAPPISPSSHCFVIASSLNPKAPTAFAAYTHKLADNLLLIQIGIGDRHIKGNPPVPMPSLSSALH